eukprot:scaffold1872_cov262-Amphora_coffeaeformis.AAC.8
MAAAVGSQIGCLASGMGHNGGITLLLLVIVSLKFVSQVCDALSILPSGLELSLDWPPHYCRRGYLVEIHKDPTKVRYVRLQSRYEFVNVLERRGGRHGV